jgi:CRP/FNR family cyclic AMP-dependent transcriptional regulator
MAPLFDVATVLEKLSYLPLETRQPGELLLAEGSSTGRLYLLKDGLVEVVRDGVQIAVIDTPGAVFGDVAVLLGQPHSADVRALEPSTFLVADGRTCLLINPAAAVHVATVLAERLDTVNRQLVEVRRRLEAEPPAHEVGEMIENIAEPLPYAHAS